MAASPPRPPDHPLLKSLWGPLRADVQADLRLALQVGLLASEGFTRREIADRTGAKPTDLRRAWERLERVAPQIDRDSPFEP